MTGNTTSNSSTEILDFKWKCPGKLQAARMGLLKTTFRFNDGECMNKHNHLYRDKQQALWTET